MPKAKILIVEDEQIVAEETKRRLQNTGYEVTAIVSSGSGALSQIKKNSPDLVLMDIMLRGKMDGIETADLIRIRFDIPVVYVTAYADFKTLARAKKTEPFGFITKPFDSGELNGSIETALYKYGIEKKLRENEKKLSIRNQQYETFLENDLFGVWRVDFKEPVLTTLSHKKIAMQILETGYIAECNNLLIDMYGFKSKNEFVGKPIKKLVVEREAFLKRLAKVAKNDFRAEMVDTEEIDSKGNIHYFRNSYFGNIHNQRLYWLWGFQLDITKRKRAEEALRVKDSAIATSINAIALADLEGNLTYVNPSFLELWGYDDDREILGKPAVIFWQFAEKAEEVIEALRGEKGWRGELVAKRKDGSPFHVELSASMVTDEAGNPVSMLASFVNITDRKQAEEQIKKDLKEKEVLLKEIHHRVKNNLQVISSLLGLQAKHIKDKQALEMFEKSKNRVRSMALIHEALYRSKDFVNIDFAKYIKNLTDQLVKTYIIDSGKIELDFKFEDVSLGIDQAIPIGLVINELVSNALKYAFPPSFERKDKIEITLQPAEAGEIELIVKDNGVGIPKELDIRKTESLGMQLIYILCEDQLDGKVTLDRRGGTKFTIRFKQE